MQKDFSCNFYDPWLRGVLQTKHSKLGSSEQMSESRRLVNFMARRWTGAERKKGFNSKTFLTADRIYLLPAIKLTSMLIRNEIHEKVRQEHSSDPASIARKKHQHSDRIQERITNTSRRQHLSFRLECKKGKLNW